MNRKEILLLIGKKGSGKSFIGLLMDREFGVKFIRVEDWAKRIKKDRSIDNEIYLKQVFEEIEKGIRQAMDSVDKVVFESTGLTDHFDHMLQSLQKDYKVTTITVDAHNNTCLDRVKSRDQSIHIKVSDDQVFMINRKVAEKSFQSDFRINNESKSEQALIVELDSLLKLIAKQ